MTPIKNQQVAPSPFCALEQQRVDRLEAELFGDEMTGRPSLREEINERHDRLYNKIAGVSKVMYWFGTAIVLSLLGLITALVAQLTKH